MCGESWLAIKDSLTHWGPEPEKGSDAGLSRNHVVRVACEPNYLNSPSCFSSITAVSLECQSTDLKQYYSAHKWSHKSCLIGTGAGALALL